MEHDNSLFSVLAVHISEAEKRLEEETIALVRDLEIRNKLGNVFVTPWAGHTAQIHSQQIVLPSSYRRPQIQTDHCIITGQEARLCIASFASMIHSDTPNCAIHLHGPAVWDRGNENNAPIAPNGWESITQHYSNKEDGLGVTLWPNGIEINA